MTLKEFQSTFNRTPTQEEIERLSFHLTNWNRLNEVFQLGTLSDKDYHTLFFIEINTKKRKRILDKIKGKLVTSFRKHVEGIIEREATRKTVRSEDSKVREK